MATVDTLLKSIGLEVHAIKDLKILNRESHTDQPLRQTLHAATDHLDLPGTRQVRALWLFPQW